MYTYQSASAQLNPDLSCKGCPSTDTRVQVQDTTVAPWDAIGLLARAQQAISKCASIHAARPAFTFVTVLYTHESRGIVHRIFIGATSNLHTLSFPVGFGEASLRRVG